MARRTGPAGCALVGVAWGETGRVPRLEQVTAPLAGTVEGVPSPPRGDNVGDTLAAVATGATPTTPSRPACSQPLPPIPLRTLYPRKAAWILAAAASSSDLFLATSACSRMLPTPGSSRGEAVVAILTIRLRLTGARSEEREEGFLGGREVGRGEGFLGGREVGLKCESTFSVTPRSSISYVMRSFSFLAVWARAWSLSP